MKRSLFYTWLLAFMCAGFVLPSYAQEASADSLLQVLTLRQNQSSNRLNVLPDRLDAGKSWLWGENGLMRKGNRYPLTPEGRAHELEVRRRMLNIHQATGYLTSGLIIATAIAGQKVFNNEIPISTHRTIERFMVGSYIATASLSIFSPPPLIKRKSKGFSNIKIHKALACVHLTGIILNAGFGRRIAPNNRPLHRAIGITTASAVLGSMIVMKF